MSELKEITDEVDGNKIGDTDENKIDDTLRAADFVYVIKVPIEVSTSIEEDYEVIQVGKASTLEGLRKRLMQHNRAWALATGCVSSLPTSTSDKKHPLSQLLVQNRHIYRGLIGLYIQSEDNEEKIDHVEAFFRSLFGAKLRTSLVKDLLQQPWEGLAGRTVFNKYQSDWSLTELLLVSKYESVLIAKLFRSQWELYKEVSKEFLLDFYKTFTHILVPGVNVQLKANYTTTTLTKLVKGDYAENRLPVEVEQKVMLKKLVTLKAETDVDTDIVSELRNKLELLILSPTTTSSSSSR